MVATNRPYVCMNMAMTADGKVTSATREYPKFTTPADKRTMDVVRAEADAVMIGAGTLRADDPPMHVRDPELLAERTKRGQPAGLLQIVVSRSLNLRREAAFFTSPKTLGCIVATTETADASALSPIPQRTELWRMGRGNLVDLPALFTRLYDRGVKKLLVEGGPQLNWHCLENDLFDELYVTIAPSLLGGTEAPTWLGGVGFTMAQQRKLELLQARVEGSEIFCHYKVLRGD